MSQAGKSFEACLDHCHRSTNALIVTAVNSLQLCFTEKNSTSNDVVIIAFDLFTVLSTTYSDIMMSLEKKDFTLKGP